MKKVFYIINLAALIITLLAYLTIFGGMVCQPFLGGIQLVSAFVFSVRWKLLHAQTKKLLRIYWFMVILFGAMTGIGAIIEEYFRDAQVNQIIDNDAVLIAWIFVFPMCIAIYFTWTAFRAWKNEDAREITTNTLDEEFIRN